MTNEQLEKTKVISVYDGWKYYDPNSPANKDRFVPEDWRVYESASRDGRYFLPQEMHYHDEIDWIWDVAKKASEEITISVIASTKYPDEVEGKAMFLKAEINSALICFNIQKLFNATYEAILFINEHIQQP